MGSGLVCSSAQVAPPSDVLKIRERLPAPIDRMYAVRSSNASMSRKSLCSAPGTGLRFQVLPPSTVSSTVPALPLAQATLVLTALTPRSRADEPEASKTHWAAEFG